MKKIIIPVSILIFGALFLYVNLLAEIDNEPVEYKSTSAEKIKIAACPTCFEMAKNLDTEKYQVIPTASTAESATLLAQGSVDMILAGRTLRLDEPAADSLVLAAGYSFLAQQPLTVYSDELKASPIFTDIDPVELELALPGFEFQSVDDVYAQLGEGIVLTTWENTDYARAQIVHVVERDGTRLARSRQPTLYCPTDCSPEIAADIKTAFD